MVDAGDDRRPGDHGRDRDGPEAARLREGRLTVPPDRADADERALVDIDVLEAMLVAAARARQTVTYGEILSFFGRRMSRPNIRALCRDIGVVCDRNRARGEPELAVLVVRKSDRLPGAGFFRSLQEEGRYAGPPTGPEAERIIASETAAVFAAFAEKESVEAD